MTKHISFLIILLTVLICSPKTGSAQTVDLLAGNILNGAVQGTLLGGASMAMANSSDFSYLRVGVGMGTLYGVGLAAYDLSKSNGRALLVSGLLNDGTNSSVIVMLDTFYGAALGSVIVTSIMLVANEPITSGLQYGAGIGAWAGFGFGMFDSFILSKRSYSPVGVASNISNKASGLLGVSFTDNTSIGLVNPSLFQGIEMTQSDLTSSIQASVDVLNLKVNF